MTEAERLAIELLQPIDEFEEPTYLETQAAELLRKLQAENERLSTLCDKWNLECDEYREDNKRLAAELDAAMVDAKRYQWLREQPALDLKSDGSIWTNNKGKFVASHRLCAGHMAYSPYSTLDEIIDAAIKQQGETP